MHYYQSFLSLLDVPLFIGTDMLVMKYALQ